MLYLWIFMPSVRNGARRVTTDVHKKLLIILFPKKRAITISANYLMSLHMLAYREQVVVFLYVNRVFCINCGNVLQHQ